MRTSLISFLSPRSRIFFKKVHTLLVQLKDAKAIKKTRSFFCCEKNYHMMRFIFGVITFVRLYELLQENTSLPELTVDFDKCYPP